MITSAGKRQGYELPHLPSKMMNNRVLVKIEVKEGDGRKLNTKLDLVVSGTEFNETAHVVRHGVVSAVPKRLVFRDSENGDSDGMMEWGTEMEVEVGDTVYFGTIASANAESLTVGDDLYYIIPYSRLILSIRDEKIIMLNGYALFEEVIDKVRVTGLVLEFGDHVNKRMGVVTHFGKPNSFYHGSEAMDAELEVGEEVVFEKKFYGYLEDELFAMLPKGTGYCQRCWVIANI